jgi:hypothetical protein
MQTAMVIPLATQDVRIFHILAWCIRLFSSSVLKEMPFVLELVGSNGMWFVLRKEGGNDFSALKPFGQF